MPEPSPLVLLLLSLIMIVFRRTLVLRGRG
ncbi:PEP-CTERM sorting domain-containing protein [Alteromonas sp. CYL-A6]